MSEENVNVSTASAVPPRTTLFFYGEHKSSRNAPIRTEFRVQKTTAPSTERKEDDDKAEKQTALAKPVDPEAHHGGADEEPTPGSLSAADQKGKRKSNDDWKKPKGKKQRNKNRAPEFKLCTKIGKGEVCPYPACKYSHDLDAYMATKPKDIGDRCYIFDQFGKCQFGLTCRFAGAHTKDNKTVVNEELHALKGASPMINHISNQASQELSRFQRKFPRADKLIKEFGFNTKSNDKNEDSKPSSCVSCEPAAEKPSIEDAAPSSELAAVPVFKDDGVAVPSTLLDAPASTYVETALKQSEKKQLNWKGKLYLAPLTTNGNLPFRRICKRLGADITCGEMAVAQNLLSGQKSEWALLRRHPSEDIFGIQVCGAFPDQMTKCAELLEQENIQVDFVDINSGCPIDIVFNKGMGSALLGRAKRMESILRGMSGILSSPVTIKLRTGIEDGKLTAHKLIPHLQSWGASAVTLHGRTRAQRYTKIADWDYIDQCSKISPIPLVGNGDLYNWEEAVHYMDNTSISSIMIARGALIKPWIFTEIKERRHWDISSHERFEIVKEFANYGMEHWGSDAIGIENTRSFLLNALSFMHRYVPVGLLETLPSRLSDFPGDFVGRDDMETLLGSRNSADWVKISEMVLGPVPSGFSFVPKHKSNSYETQESQG